MKLWRSIGLPFLLLILCGSMLISCQEADDDDDQPDDDDHDSDDDDDDNDTAPPPLEDWRFITDADGRAQILHGCNYDGSAKDDDGLPNLNEEDARELAETWGFNFARYLIFWARIEPEPGVYDEDYLDAVQVRLDYLHEAGFQVVLDMHQDLWGPFITEDWGGSDGAPEWATITDGWPHIPLGEMFGGWAFNYLSPAVNKAFDNFWDYQGPHPELQDHYAAMWIHVAERFGDHPAILGYDPMNEPWQGTGLIRYREFDETKYHDFNQRMIDAIRTVDDERWIFYEPCAFGPNQGLPSYQGVLDDPRPGKNRLAYFPHLYPVLVDLLGGYDPEFDNALTNWERNRKIENDYQKSPLLLGEWSMLFWFDDANRHLWLDGALPMIDRVSSGWAYWDCRWFLNDHDEKFRHRLASIYPRYVSGYPLSYEYRKEAKEFVLIFEQRDEVTGPTEIYLPATRNYPEGWVLEVSDPADSWSSEWDADREVLYVWTDPDIPEHTIKIRSQKQP